MKVAKKGSSTHSLGKRQMEIGKFQNSAKNIIEKHPDMIEDVFQLVKVYGNLVDDVYYNNKGYEMGDLMIELLITDCELNIEKK